MNIHSTKPCIFPWKSLESNFFPIREIGDNIQGNVDGLSPFCSFCSFCSFASFGVSHEASHLCVHPRPDFLMRMRKIHQRDFANGATTFQNYPEGEYPGASVPNPPKGGGGKSIFGTCRPRFHPSKFRRDWGCFPVSFKGKSAAREARSDYRPTLTFPEGKNCLRLGGLSESTEPEPGACLSFHGPQWGRDTYRSKLGRQGVPLHPTTVSRGAPAPFSFQKGGGLCRAFLLSICPSKLLKNVNL